MASAEEDQFRVLHIVFKSNSVLFLLFILAAISCSKSAWAESEIKIRRYDDGGVYEGTVIELRDFGAIIELLRNKEGLCHISELAEKFPDYKDSLQAFLQGFCMLVQSLHRNSSCMIQLNRCWDFLRQGADRIYRSWR